MSTRKATVAGVLAIAVFFGAALLILDWVMRDGPERPSKGAVSADAQPVALPPPPALPPMEADSSIPVTVVQPGPPPPVDAPYVPPEPHRAPRGSAAPVDLLSSLAQVRRRIFACAGNKLTIPNPPKRPPPLPGHGAGLEGRTVFMLDLEQAEGEVIVADVSIQSRGDATDELIACAQHELAGQRLPAGSARSGKNVKMQFPIDPPGR